MYKKIASLLESNETEGIFSEFIFSSSSKEIFYSYYYPVYFVEDRRGKIQPAGVCRVLCKLTSLQDRVMNISLNKNLQCWVLDDSNMILASNDLNSVGKNYENLYHISVNNQE